MALPRVSGRGVDLSGKQGNECACAQWPCDILPRQTFRSPTLPWAGEDLRQPRTPSFDTFLRCITGCTSIQHRSHERMVASCFNLLPCLEVHALHQAFLLRIMDFMDQKAPCEAIDAVSVVFDKGRSEHCSQYKRADGAD